MKQALQAYHKEEAEYPESLAVLGSKYISAIPEDPFDGEALRYDRTRGIIYSVGKNLKDDGGKDGSEGRYSLDNGHADIVVRVIAEK